MLKNCSLKTLDGPVMGMYHSRAVNDELTYLAPNGPRRQQTGRGTAL